MEYEQGIVGENLEFSNVFPNLDSVLNVEDCLNGEVGAFIFRGRE